MNLLWVCRRVANSTGGDAVVDRKLVEELRKSHRVTTIDVARNPLGKRLLRILTRFLPPDRAGFGSSADAARILSVCRSENADAIVLSHEHLDYLAGERELMFSCGSVPIILLSHNVTSSAMKEIFQGWPGRVAQRAYRLYEGHSLVGARISAHVALSLDDQRLLREITNGGDVTVVAPGAPPPMALAPRAQVAPELVLLGSYDWYPKRWSLRRFGQQWVGQGERSLPLYADGGLPVEVREGLGARPAGELNFENAIRFGIITDRFKAGHKLKTAAYVMANCVVLSFADVAEDYRFSPHADFLIRRIRHVSDIGPIVAEFRAMDVATVRARVTDFKRDIAEELSWQRQAEVLSTVVTSTVRKARERH